MSYLISETLQQTLANGLNHDLLSKIQSCNTSVETLTQNLSSLRQIDKRQAFSLRLQKIQGYLELKKRCHEVLQIQSDEHFVIEWLESSVASSSPLLFELIRSSELVIKKQAIQIAKQTIFTEEVEKIDFFEENTRGRKLVRRLREVVEQEKTSTLQRTQIIELDEQISYFDHRMQSYEEKIQQFNRRMKNLFKRICSFEDKIKDQFQEHLSVPSHISTKNANSRSSSFSNKQATPNRQSFKEYRESEHQEERETIAHSTKVTPRKLLEEPAVENFYDLKLLNSGGSFYRGQQLKKQTRDRDSDMYLHRKLNKTMQTFNRDPYLSRTSGQQMYTHGLGGQPIRVSSQWRNSRSSISYNPMRS